MFLWVAKLPQAPVVMPTAPRLSQADSLAASASTRLGKRLERTTIVVLANGIPQGVAAFIDSSGYFIAHQASVIAKEVDAVTYDGQTVHLKVRALDSVTKLWLLQATGPLPSGLQAISVANLDQFAGMPVLISTANTTIAGTFVSGDRVGVVKNSNRVLPLSEIRFEAPGQSFAGAMVFASNGDFIGPISATLAATNAVRNEAQYDSFPLRGVPNAGQMSQKSAMRFGPAQLTVAYVPGYDLIRHVVAGFKSPTKAVEYASLGITCRDAVGGGALVQTVVENSSADRGGVKAGDVLIGMDTVTIKTQLDFARVLLSKQPGSKTSLRIRRGTSLVVLDVQLGKLDGSKGI